MTNVAFKEWASVVLALERGEQQLIFRKGGIAEEGRGFAIAHDRFLLFPTYFHQQKVGVRESYSPLYEDAMRRKPPEGRVIITSWIQVRRSFTIESERDLPPLETRHVYAPHILIERLHGRHGSALFALEVDVHLLERPLDLPLLERYGGCRSWVDLELPPV
ncbi:MAG: DUF1802 family protein [Polyangiaceae bacterium]